MDSSTFVASAVVFSHELAFSQFIIIVIKVRYEIFDVIKHVIEL